MRLVDDQRARFLAAGVVGDERGTVVNADAHLADVHLDATADQAVRHAVAHSVDVNEGVIREMSNRYVQTDIAPARRAADQATARIAAALIGTPAPARKRKRPTRRSKRRRTR